MKDDSGGVLAKLLGTHLNQAVSRQLLPLDNSSGDSRVFSMSTYKPESTLPSVKGR